MSKKTITTALCLLTGIIALAQKATDDFSGKWKTEEGKTILVTKSGNTFTGTTEDKKGIVLKEIKFTDGKWKGIIQKPDGSTKADCEIVLDKKNLRIVAKKLFFTKKIVWEKQ